MIYIAGKNECTGAEMCRAERYIGIILVMLGGETDLGSGYVLGGDKGGRASYMDGAYSDIESASVVIFLPGWEKHKELQMQHMYCKYIGKRIMYFKLTAKGATLTLPRSKKYKKETKTCRTWKKKS